MRHDRGFEETAMAPWRRFPLHIDAPVCDALRTGEPVYLETLDDWEHYPSCAAASPGAFAGDGRRPARASAASCIAALVLCNREARRFMAADRAFLAALADQAAHALERARLYEERAYVARTLQAGLLPERLADIPGLEVAVRYHSIADGGAVGGDFYDCFDISPDRWLVVVGDVAGKGTAAAVLTGLARHTLRAIALRDERPEDDAAVPQRGAAPAVVRGGVLHGRLRDARARRRAAASRRCLASGGHPYPLLVRAGGARRGGRRARHAARRRGRAGARAGAARRSRPATRSCSTPTAWSTRATRPASGSARSGCARRSTPPRAASAEAVADAVDEAVAAFEPDVQRDDRAIVVLRVSG